VNKLLLLLVLMLSTLVCSEISAQKRKGKEVIPASSPEKIVLADHGISNYRIVVPVHPTLHETKAAETFQKYLLEIAGAALPIIAADKGRSEYEIVLGQNERLDQIPLKIDYKALQEDGFLIQTDSLRLVITGGAEKGTLFGVYTFLEKFLGCRMYSPTAKIIPHSDRIELASINHQEIPVIHFRDTHYRVTWDAEYTDWHKLDHDPHGERTDWGMWVHTFNELVPPTTYYASHPEYFAMVNGKRLPTQLCLANSDVLSLAVQNLRKKIAQNPQAKYWSVSQNDNRDYCTCDQCRSVDSIEGSPSGSIISFVNKVADEFPDKMISTLAYEYGRRAPRNLKPRENVNIMLCSIEAFRDKPIADDSSSAAFVKDVKDWGKIAKDIIVWDYVIQFNHLLSPFPNLQVLQPNIKFFAENGVTALFEQGNREVGGEFAALRSYMISKLLWDPYLDADSLMNDFLSGYYGAASKPIRLYIDLMRGELLKSKKPLRIFGSPCEAAESYLTPALLEKYNALFDQAESLVQDSTAILERVRIARLPLMYATMEQAKKNFTGNDGLFERTDGKWQVRTDIRNMVDQFTDLCIREGVTRVKEWSTSPEEYRSSMYRIFSQGMNEHLAFGKKITLISPDTIAINSEKLKMLVDGKRGSHDYDNNWVNFGGKDLEAIIDLEKVESVRKIGSGYYQLGFWLRLLPVKVDYFTSTDGKTFEPAGSIVNTLPIDQYGGFLREFNVEFAPRPARYIKIWAHSMGNTPGWHPGAGRPARMLIDEIVVE
jgi:hypothetical protein